MSCKTVTRVSMTVNISVATSMPSVTDPKTTLSVCKLKPKLIGNRKQTDRNQTQTLYKRWVNPKSIPDLSFAKQQTGQLQRQHV